MPSDNLARLNHASDQGPDARNAMKSVGRVVSVSGSQVTVEFTREMLVADEGRPEVTVGTFLGVWNGRSLVVGALCDVSLHKHADGQQAEPATGKIDLLGELILETPGAGYFQRGVMNYPRIGS